MHDIYRQKPHQLNNTSLLPSQPSNPLENPLRLVMLAIDISCPVTDLVGVGVVDAVFEIVLSQGVVILWCTVGFFEFALLFLVGSGFFGDVFADTLETAGVEGAVMGEG